jgi:hypothetical protein
MDYRIRDHDRLDIFISHITTFRQWMADHGQREKPLLVPEYGILMWSDIVDEDGQDFSDDRVIDFMYGTFDFFLTATDPDLGYPADGNRLVQAWAWYSTDDNSYGQLVSEGYNGDLFTGEITKSMTALGLAYADYVSNTVGIGPAYTDLYPLRFEADMDDLVWGQPAIITLTAEVVNLGRQPASDVEVQFWNGDPAAGGVPIGGAQTISSIPARYEGSGMAGVIWSTTVSGTHTLWVEVDPQRIITETDEINNLRPLSATLEGDLFPGGIILAPPVPLWEGVAVTVTATAVVTNAGPVGIPAGAEACFAAGGPALCQILGPLPAGTGTQVSAQLPFASPGPHQVELRVDPTGAVVETDETNNVATAQVLVATERLFLPVTLRDS